MRRLVPLTLTLLSLLSLLAGGAASASSAACEWTPSGRIQVDHVLESLADTYGISDVANVRVEIAVKGKFMGIWSPWVSWGQVRTNTAGRFSITHDSTCGLHRFRVRIKFDDGALEIGSGWHTVIEEGAADAHTGGGVANVGDVVLDGWSQNNASVRRPRALADLWVLYHDILDLMTAYGAGHAFTSKIDVDYPYALTSYANPLTQRIHLEEYKDEAAFRNSHREAAHELMHVWAYQHSQGEAVLAGYLLTNWNTHGLVSSPNVAFHEGFATYAADELLYELYGRELLRPLGRAGLRHFYHTPGYAAEDIMSLHDGAIFRALQLLTTPNLHRYWIGTANDQTTFADDQNRGGGRTQRCDSPDVTFADVLSAFFVNGQLDNTDLQLYPFTQRVADVTSGLSNAQVAGVYDVWDYFGFAQPDALFCDPITPDGPVGTPPSDGTF